MSNARPVAKMTDDHAALWATRLDLGTLAVDQEAALEAWLAENPLHQGALLRAQATLAYLDRGRALSSTAVRQEECRASNDATALDRRRFLRYSAGAGALAAGLGAIMIVPRLGRDDIRTDIGEVRRVPLADGSVAVLNTASRLAVALRPKQRAIQLEEGEAWFQVAHDKSRPFVVKAGDVRVRAVGTAFAVRRRAESADVLVTEGVVETWIEGREGSLRRLTAGDRSYVSAGVQPAASTVQNIPQEVERALAWRSGEIVLDGQSVEYAVAELNRYNRQHILIGDTAIGRERLIGYFRTNDPAKFARAVAEMTGAQVVEKEGDLLLTQ
ncbi:iron dicitrate transport regulator FecR [Sphingobium lactosutens]|uniref:FecR family protein n=1 Tax=Sphingobium lactosutens TaxID=522773 RepID=UPI0015B79D89|nr:FecR domain-containing protein [Sphingobium lactosutens]NWK94318.1 iron dicitrate transport regulator FecR [Sphingobium lactosutens]